MKNSAAIAKDRLGYSQWLDRVDELLAVAGLRRATLVRTEGEYDMRSYYNAGLRAGRVAEVIIDFELRYAALTRQMLEVVND